MRTCKLCVEIEYDPTATDPEALASMMDHFFQSVSGIFDVGNEDYGHPVVGEFFVVEDEGNEEEE